MKQTMIEGLFNINNADSASIAKKVYICCNKSK